MHVRSRAVAGLVAGAVVLLGLPAAADTVAGKLASTVASPAAGSTAMRAVGSDATRVAASTVTVASEPVPAHTRLVPSTPRTDTPRITSGEITDIEVIGNRVFIAGTFTSIANVGATPIAQKSLASYNIDTGKIDTGFRPTFDGSVEAVEASPDGSSLYVAGSFNTISGVTKRKIVRLNPLTGAPIAGFTATADGRATALAVSSTAVYVGGQFSKVNGVSRRSLVALNPTTGAVDSGFNLPLSGGIGVGGLLTVQQLKLTHDDSKLLVVHTGRQIAGQDRYGVGLVNTATRALLPWRTRLWEDNLSFVGGIQRVFAGDIAPDDSYFVVTSGSGGDRPPINDTAIAFPTTGNDNVEPLWVSRHFDSVYSVAITEKAVYVGGHFSWQESPTSPVPWPGLDNVGYGTGQGLSGYGLGDQVVRRDHLGALDPKTGTALEWNPGSNSYEGDKAMLATSRGLFVGGDGNIKGGKTVGRVGFFDLSKEPAASAVDTTIVTPIEGSVKQANEAFVLDGKATAPAGVSRVQIEIQNRGSKQYLQDDLTTWGAANSINATLAAPNATSTGWSLSVALPVAEYQVQAKAFGRDGTSDPTKAVKKIETFRFDDLPPTTTVTAPTAGLLTTTSFVATGTASDDKGVSAMTYWLRTPDNRYLQDDGTLAPVYNTFRGEPDVIGALSTTWQLEVTLPIEGDWKLMATAIDTAGQSDLRGATREWTVSSTGVAPTVAISTPVPMTPPTVAAPHHRRTGRLDHVLRDRRRRRHPEVGRDLSPQHHHAGVAGRGRHVGRRRDRGLPPGLTDEPQRQVVQLVLHHRAAHARRVRLPGSGHRQPGPDDGDRQPGPALRHRPGARRRVPERPAELHRRRPEHRAAAPRPGRHGDRRQGRAGRTGGAAGPGHRPVRAAERHHGGELRHGERHARLARRDEHHVHPADRPADQG